MLNQNELIESSECFEIKSRFDYYKAKLVLPLHSKIIHIQTYPLSQMDYEPNQIFLYLNLGGSI